MPVYRLVEELVFPPPGLAEPSGLLAVGGDLTSARLLLAYSMGIFPWFNDDDPLLWWSPDPRCVLFPDELHISRSLAKTIRRGRYRVTFNKAFGEVIAACAGVRQEQGDETWITLEMLEAYQRLHRQGYAHSVECWQGDELVGGLYGVCLGRFFFGESMFHRHVDASKVAFAALVQSLKAKDFLAVDCQLPTSHLQSLGARNVSRQEFLDLLSRGDLHPTPHPSKGLFPEAPMTIAAA